MSVVQKSWSCISCSLGVLVRPKSLLILTWTSKLMVTSSSSFKVSSYDRSYRSVLVTCIFMLEATLPYSYLFVTSNVSVTL